MINYDYVVICLAGRGVLYNVYTCLNSLHQLYVLFNLISGWDCDTRAVSRESRLEVCYRKKIYYSHGIEI